MPDLKAKLKKIKLLACDFDGVFTNGMVYFGKDGSERVRCSRKDGLAVHMLKKHGIAMCVISKEENPVVTRRCEKMKITCYQGVKTGDGKAEILARVAKKLGLRMSEVAFMGDDLNDVGAMKRAGVAITVSDGHAAVKKIADIITRARGGEHAVREAAEQILAAKGIKSTAF